MAFHVIPIRQPIIYARPFPARGHVGIHYWFEDENAHVFSENQASNGRGILTLHIRNNVGGGFLTVWSVDGEGVELTPREGAWAGYRMTAEPFVVPAKLQSVPGEQQLRFIVVFGRSQTEMAGTAASARRRLIDLSSRVGRDGTSQIIRETDDATPRAIGTYVVNREGMPVAAEVTLPGRVTR
jgi:hypothetical protein